MRVGHNATLPEDMAQFEPIAARIAEKARDCRIGCEQKLALNKDLEQRKWFDKDVWVRGIIDVILEKGSSAFVGDYKTGKKLPDSAQLRLTAAMVFQTRPWVKNITNTFLWLKTGETTTEKFTREDIPAIWQEFAPRVRRMEQAHEENVWPKRSSGLCREWCPVHHCEHNGKFKGRK